MAKKLINSSTTKSFQEAELEVVSEKSFRKIVKNINFIALGATSLGIALTSQSPNLSQSNLSIWMMGYAATVIGPVILATILIRNGKNRNIIPDNEKIMQDSYDAMNPNEKEYIKSELKRLKNLSENDGIKPILSLRENFIDKQISRPKPRK
jgi:ABC-type dipeptide/oligopeptide/nickel transport system ATPase subunit